MHGYPLYILCGRDESYRKKNDVLIYSMENVLSIRFTFGCFSNFTFYDLIEPYNLKNESFLMDNFVSIYVYLFCIRSSVVIETLRLKVESIDKFLVSNFKIE